MTVATWNVNSIRARCDHLVRWLELRRPTVCCLQELKCTEAEFPYFEFEARGYHCVVFGEKARNGVALLTTETATAVQRGFDNGFDAGPARLLAARVAGIDIVNIYVPNGQAPDTPAFEYKRDFLRELRAQLARRYRPEDPLVLLGDCNVAPDDDDVYDPARLRGSVCFHPDEQADILHLKTWGLQDVFRHLHPHGRHFSWWDYRAGAFARNEGMRLDHILATPALVARCTCCEIDRTPRGWERPSDHTPVLAEFADD
jgi:exodeoxyribonuclease-3